MEDGFCEKDGGSFVCSCSAGFEKSGDEFVHKCVRSTPSPTPETGAAPTPRPTTAPTPSAKAAKEEKKKKYRAVKVASRMSGFDISTFTQEYQDAYIRFMAKRLSKDRAKITNDQIMISNIKNIDGRRLLEMDARHRALTAVGISFDLTISLVAEEVAGGAITEDTAVTPFAADITHDTVLETALAITPASAKEDFMSEMGTSNLEVRNIEVIEFSVYVNPEQEPAAPGKDSKPFFDVITIGAMAGGLVVLVAGLALVRRSRPSRGSTPLGDGGASVLDEAANRASGSRAKGLSRGKSARFGFSNPMSAWESFRNTDSFQGDGSSGGAHNPMHARPDEDAASAAARESMGAAGAVTKHNPLPRGWFESSDPNTGNTYYYNDVGDTTWVRPTVSIV